MSGSWLSLSGSIHNMQFPEGLWDIFHSGQHALTRKKVPEGERRSLLWGVPDLVQHWLKTNVQNNQVKHLQQVTAGLTQLSAKHFLLPATQHWTLWRRALHWFPWLLLTCNSYTLHWTSWYMQHVTSSFAVQIKSMSHSWGTQLTASLQQISHHSFPSGFHI